jgi:2-hydroxychromene-2-carboxylate isomerase
MWLARALAYASLPMSQINHQPRFAKRGCFGLKGFQIFSGQIFWGRFSLLDF